MRRSRCVHEVRTFTEALAAPLSGEDQTVQSMPDVSPTKWHRAHTTWFFETFVLPARAARATSEFDPQFGYLFNSYYEAVGDAASARRTRAALAPGHRTRSRRTARTSTPRCSTAIDDDGTPSSSTSSSSDCTTSSSTKSCCSWTSSTCSSTNPLRPAYRAVRAGRRRATSDPREWTEHDGGLVEIGHDAASGFAFDNESPRHRVFLEPFAIADRPVTSGDWLAFIADDGYHRPELWLSDGWAAVQAQGLGRTAVLGSGDGDGLAGVHARAACNRSTRAEPVCHVSYYEADAFARWSGARLPTEAEWEHAAGALVGGRSIPRSGPVAPGLDLRRPRRSSATCGSGPGPRTCPYPRFGPRPARSVSTTASSW